MPIIFGRVLASGIMVPVNVDTDGDLQIDVKGALPAGTALIGDVGARNLGWVSAAWQKDPLRFGYSAHIYRAWSNLNLPAGNSTQADTAVPAGEIWVITNIAMRYEGTAPTFMTMQINDGVTTYHLFRQLAPTTLAVYDRQGWWVLAPGHNLEIRVIGATLNDDLYGYATGFRVDIDQ